LQGKTTSHEIDVYWEFFLGGIKYITLIQAKDWESKVPQGEMLKFKSVIDDIPGQPRGIFVTKTGYQPSAIDVARAHGILVYELREPTNKDWEGKVKTIVLHLQFYIPKTAIEITPDKEWMSLELKKKGIEYHQVKIEGMDHTIFVRNEAGNIRKSLFDIKNEEHNKIGMVELKNIEKIIQFDENLYIETNDVDLPLIKLSEIKLLLSSSLIEQEMIIDGESMVGFILRNILDNSEIILDKDGIIKNA